MARFSEKSTARLAECHIDLQRVFNIVIRRRDCTILCGHRGQEEQDEAFRTGKSKLQWPYGKHNTKPSSAIDVVPYPVNWNDKQSMIHFAGYVLGVAEGLGIKLRWGGDWNGNFDLKDENFFDLPHFELDESATILPTLK
jgi:peptidoglycan L-alanyl-D-glutamate endopeptidase CwlK